MDYKTAIRIYTMITVFFMVLVAYTVRLYSVQITKTEETVSTTENYVFRSVVYAARGNILDRNGNFLVSNRASYNIAVNQFIVYSQQNTNENILSLISKCRELGVETIDHLPVSRSLPYSLELDSLTSVWQSRYKTFMSARDWDVDITAAGLMRLLKRAYSIPDTWSDEDARDVVAVRYELELRSYDYSLSTYVLCEDISSEALAALSEMNLPGVNVETATVREYNTDYAAHVLGTVGKMTAEEYEYYKDKDYAMDAIVGKDGFELAFEEYLHGTDGIKYTVISPAGEVVREYYEVEPVTGMNVEVTLDMELQAASEKALAATIETYRAEGIYHGLDSTGMDVEGGAVVVQHIDTGEILACASYPTFHLETYSEDFNDLIKDDLTPLYNRALQATYAPGSTYKMVTAITAVDFLGINPYSQIYDNGIYTKYEETGFTPMCMRYKNQGWTHEYEDLVKAISVSCNYYFYVMGDRIFYATNQTNDAIDEVAAKLGLGEKTGVELPESTGYRANPETKAKLFSGTSNSGFFMNDAVSSAIGQSENKFTVVQLCAYVAAIANHGTRLRSTFLRRVVASDYSFIVKQNQPEVMAELEISDLAWDAIHQGMLECATDRKQGTAQETFANFFMTVCAKTGTAEHDKGGSSHAAFVCYVPAGKPELAIAVYIEKAGGGSAAAPVAASIITSYYNEDSEGSEYIIAEGIPQ